MSVSLWLVPCEDHPFTKALQELVSDTVPSKVESTSKIPHFVPHVTLVSDIDPKKTYECQGKSAQEWLDSLQLPEPKNENEEVHLELYGLEAGDDYFRKLYVTISKQDNLKELAALCRQQGILRETEDRVSESTARFWAENEYAPHMSLMYGEVPYEVVKKKTALIEMHIGFTFGDLFACCGGALCLGGSIVLMDTSKPVEEWIPVAQRETPWIMWKMNRDLG